MASYRYERDIKPEELLPNAERTYTRRERWANWWDYNLHRVIIGAIFAAFIGYCFIGQYFFTDHPDYNIAVVAPYFLPEQTVTALQRELAAFGEDLNRDGKVTVSVNVYTVSYAPDDAETESDAYLTMSGTTKLAADVQGSLSGIFLLADPAGFQEATGSLRYLDGTLPVSGSDKDWWRMVYRWGDCPVLTGLPLGDYGPDSTHSASGSSQTYLSDFYVAMRGAWTNDSAAALSTSEPMWQAMTEGAVSTAVKPEKK